MAFKISGLSKKDTHFLRRQLTPRAMDVIGSRLYPRLSSTIATVAAVTAVAGDIQRVDATAQNVVVTAPDPTQGGSFGIKLVATASSHTVVGHAAASELFDGTTVPAATSTVGALWVWQSDGVNWNLITKI